mmetsp:Transcript_13337/g.20001  ORF Transcript_13337/g.20001 Transcript_13337/m.20001 type:complete len:329 (+) Transcript_13337:3-989(+)
MKDLADTPALSLGPAELEQVAIQLGEELLADEIDSVVGVKELLQQNYPQIAAVGMAAAVGREPRIVSIRWNGPKNVSNSQPDELSTSTTSNPITEEETINRNKEIDKKTKQKLPLVVIVGKGVTFDTGGLNIKGGGGMRNMKRDMTGAAQAIALALLVVDSALPVRVRLLLPIVENSISGAALRPGDVIRARNGKTTEITNTDAEGRLILADALVAATEGEDFDEDSGGVLVVDFATLTGAARMALGNDLPALFSTNMVEMNKLWNLSMVVKDPVWMMPLWEPLRSSIKASSVADLVNSADGFGGAITAALYLSEFISKPFNKNQNQS